MTADPADPMESFLTWLPHGVAQAVEAGEVPADPLADLQGKFEASRPKRPEKSHADAVRDIAVEFRCVSRESSRGSPRWRPSPR